MSDRQENRPAGWSLSDAAQLLLAIVSPMKYYAIDASQYLALDFFVDKCYYYVERIDGFLKQDLISVLFYYFEKNYSDK